MELAISTPRDFSFKRTAISHGWCELLPFEIDRDNWILRRVLDLKSDKPVTLEISARNRQLRISTSRRISQKATKQVISDVRHMLRLDDDMAGFYGLMARENEFAWVASQGAGRMLRSPTVFEDLVKMICTTNCSWALTEKMVNGLVNELGNQSDDGRKSFPSAEVMAQESVKFFKDKIRAGYRASYLQELSQRVASGSLNVEDWLTTDLTVKELLKEMKRVKGVGNYSAENLLKLLGRYDGLT